VITLDPMLGLLLIAVLIGVLVLYRLQRDLHRPEFDLADLLMHNGKLDKFAFCFMASFAMMTWMMVYMVTHKTITEGYLAIYVGAWVGPITAKIIWGKPLEQLKAPGQAQSAVPVQQTQEVKQ